MTVDDLSEVVLPHLAVHIVEIGGPVEIFGLAVRPNDFIHADRHGAVVVPSDMIFSLAGAIAKMRAAEALILDPAREPGFNFDKFVAAWQTFENARI